MVYDTVIVCCCLLPLWLKHAAVGVVVGCWLLFVAVDVCCSLFGYVRCCLVLCVLLMLAVVVCCCCSLVLLLVLSLLLVGIVGVCCLFVLFVVVRICFLA